MTDAQERISLAVRCLDLTSLEGKETEQQVIDLCRRAADPASFVKKYRPHPDEVPHVAAVVLYPKFVATAAQELRGTGVRVASVAGFPTPGQPLDARLDEIRGAIEDGADEIDIVLHRALLLAGKHDDAAAEIAAAKEVCGDRLLKVILETGELDLEQAREATLLAARAGADFVKTSTGKTRVGATPEKAQVMIEAVRAYRLETGRPVGVKVSGGISGPGTALEYIALVQEGLGDEWLTPERFRIGASALLFSLVALL
ncbi:MAG: deoxyribose-phosphate aldolase [Actinomycetota bacterium]